MKFEAIRAKKAEHPVALMCRSLGVSRSGYYAWLERASSPRAAEEEKLAGEVSASFQNSRRTYGYPRVYKDLRARGIRIGRHRTARLMRQQGLRSVHRRRWRVTTTKADPAHEVAANELDRQFKTDKPNDVWVGDSTYVRTAQGWLFLAVLVDLYARRIVGWSMQDHMRTELVLGALEMALSRRPAPRLHHSDRGSQYTSAPYRKALDEAGVKVVSMSRKGECRDNAVAESVFATIKEELVNQREFATREEARAALFDYIEVFYNRNRLHSTIGYQAPAKFEEQIAQELIG